MSWRVAGFRGVAYWSRSKAAQLRIFRRYQSKQPPVPPPNQSRIDRIDSRLPRFLQRYTKPLRNAPVTHITAFLILHELTAIVPLFGFAGFFMSTGWVPPMVGEWSMVSQGVEKFGNYFRRKGWLGEEEGLRERWWGRGQGSVKLVTAFATAYALTKVLLPIRLILSVWATPWFARWTVIPLMNGFKRLFRRTRKVQAAPLATGTGATAAGVVGKETFAKPGLPKQ